MEARVVGKPEKARPRVGVAQTRVHLRARQHQHGDQILEGVPDVTVPVGAVRVEPGPIVVAAQRRQEAQRAANVERVGAQRRHRLSAGGRAREAGPQPVTTGEGRVPSQPARSVFTSTCAPSRSSRRNSPNRPKASAKASCLWIDS